LCFADALSARREVKSTDQWNARWTNEGAMAFGLRCVRCVLVLGTRYSGSYELIFAKVGH
jgi:hypothetical protein